MIPKTYNSFEEIDTQLKILKLKRTLDKEHIAYNYNKVKYYLYPRNLVLELSNTLREKLVALIFDKFFWMF